MPLFHTGCLQCIDLAAISIDSYYEDSALFKQEGISDE